YLRFIQNHVKPSSLNDSKIQQLKSTDLKSFYGALKVSESTKAKFHAIIYSALKAAMLEGLVARNVAPLVVGKPQAHGTHEDIRSQCWTAAEARSFLRVARADGPQAAALYSLALETGMRKGELFGLQWSDVDLDAAKIRVIRQLIAPGEEPVFGPTKNG